MLILKLFLSFLQIGLFSVGGGYAAIPLIQEQIVTLHHLMTMEEFSDLITIAEMTPGPISINSSTFVGLRVSGLPGALFCTLGVITPSFFLCLLLARLYYKYRGFSGVQTVLAALRPAVVALIGSAGLSILSLALFSGKLSDGFTPEEFHWIEGGLFLICLFLLRRFKCNAVSVILGSGIAGTILYLLSEAVFPA